MSRGSVWEKWKVLKMDSGDGCSAVQIYLLPLNHTLENGYNGKLYVMYMLLQFKNETKSQKAMTGIMNLLLYLAFSVYLLVFSISKC